MAIFRGFGPRHAAGSAERPFFIFDIIIYHPKEHSVRFSALNSKIFLMATPFCVVLFRYAVNNHPWCLPCPLQGPLNSQGPWIVDEFDQGPSIVVV